MEPREGLRTFISNIKVMNDLKGYLKGLLLFALTVLFLILTSCEKQELFEDYTIEYAELRGDVFYLKLNVPDTYPLRGIDVSLRTTKKLVAGFREGHIANGSASCVRAHNNHLEDDGTKRFQIDCPVEQVDLTLVIIDAYQNKQEIIIQ